MALFFMITLLFPPLLWGQNDNLYKSHKSLVHSLCDGLNSEEEKVLAICQWISTNISYDVQAYASGKIEKLSPDKILQSKKAVYLGYADLLEAMCMEAGVKCVSIQGYAKTGRYEPGDIFVLPNHHWNAVFYNGEWHLIDLAMASGSIQPLDQHFRKKLFKVLHLPYQKKYKFTSERNMKYINADPNTFILDHLPLHPWWQLVPQKVSVNTFEKDSTEIKNFLMSGTGEPNNFMGDIDYFESLPLSRKHISKAQEAYEFNKHNSLILATGKEQSVSYWLSYKVVSDKNKMYDSCKVLLKESTDNLKEHERSVLKEKTLRIEKNKEFHQVALDFSKQQLSINQKKIDAIEAYQKRITKEIGKLNKEKAFLKKESQSLKKQKIDSTKVSDKEVILMQEMDSVQIHIDSLGLIKFKLYDDSLRTTIERNDNELKTLTEVSFNMYKGYVLKKRMRNSLNWNLRTAIGLMQEEQNELSLLKDNLWELNNSYYPQIFGFIGEKNKNAKMLCKYYQSKISMARKASRTSIFLSTVEAYKIYVMARDAEIDATINLLTLEMKYLETLKEILEKENKANQKELKEENFRYHYSNWYYNHLQEMELQQSEALKRQFGILEKQISQLKKTK
ncbi:MAG: transglutaminase domain-containing protein [Flavobacteriales bacterium]